MKSYLPSLLATLTVIALIGIPVTARAAEREKKGGPDTVEGKGHPELKRHEKAKHEIAEAKHEKVEKRAERAERIERIERIERAAARPLVVVSQPVVTHRGQPEMNDALVQLEHALKAKHPVEHLEKAKLHLEEARHNKHGERVEAIHQVNAAIAAAHKREHKAMHGHIEAAIREIREGERAARS